MTTWHEDQPATSDPLKLLGALTRNQKAQVRAGLNKHLFWDDSSGASAGVPRLSDGSYGPGSARGFYGAFSAISAYRDGGLMLRSTPGANYGQLYALTSLSSALVGGPSAVVQDSGATITPMQMMFPQSSNTTGRGPGTYVVTFATAYTAAPSFVQVSPVAMESYSYSLVSTSATSFTVSITSIGGGVTPEIGAFQWLAVGTVAIP